MDILFVTLSPIDATFSASFRNRAVIKGFIELGHSVDILTVDPYDKSITVNEADYSQRVRIIRLNKSGDQKVKDQVRLIKKGRNNFLTKIVRVIYHRIFPFDSSFFLIKNLDIKILPKKTYHLVLSSSDPKTSHLAIKRLIKLGLNYEQWIQYWGDPLAEDISTKLVYPKIILRWIERQLIKNADKIIYVSPITLKVQASSYNELSQKMIFVPIPYAKKKIYPKPNNSVFTIGYFGFYLKSVRNILPLYHAIRKSNGNMHLNIVGSSDFLLKECENVSIYANSNEVARFEANADLIVVILNLHGGQIPGKIYHLAGTNKPVLVIMDGDCKDLIRKYLEKYDRFLFCDNSEESITEALATQLVHRDKFFPSPSLDCTSIASDFLKF